MIKRLLSNLYELYDPVILDVRYHEVKDSSTTRGERFWNTNQIFYFVEKDDWEAFKVKQMKQQCDCKSNLVRIRKPGSRSKSAYFYNYKYFNF